MRVVKNVLVSLIVAATLQPACLAQGLIGRRAHPNVDPRDSAYDAGVTTRILANTQIPESCKHKASIIFQIEKGGNIARVSLLQSSGSPSVDFACLEAVAGSCPLPAPPRTSDLDLYNGAPARVDFPTQKSGKASALFFAQHPKLRGKVVLLHLVPVDVLQRYPGICSEDEILGVDNLLPVSLKSLSLKTTAPPGQGVAAEDIFRGSELSGFFKDWASFFASNSTATREVLLAEKARLRQRYNNSFHVD